MRLAVFSDIHGNLRAFEAALADYEALGGADQVWLLGDFAAFGPQPSACVARVREWVQQAEADPAAGRFVRAIRGNTDRYLVTGERMRQTPAEDADAFAAFRSGQHAVNQALLWSLDQLTAEDYATLRTLHSECELIAPGFGPVIGYHGTPGDDEGFLTPQTDAEEAADALSDREGRLGIGGHIHVQMDRPLPGGWRAINVGSVGMSFDRPGFAEWGLFTFDGGGVQVDLRAVPYDLDALIDDFRQAGYQDVAWAEKRFRQS